MSQSDQTAAVQPEPLPGRWAMALRAFLAFNIIVGCAFGGVGVALPSIREQFDVDSATASLCMSAIMLAGGLSSPFAATMIERLGIRATMMAGAALTIVGYLTLAFAPNIHVVLAAHALFIGVGVTTCGAFPAIVLANAWFQPNPGRAVGFVSMAVGVALVPLAMESVIANFGLRAFYLAFAAMASLVIPIIWGISDPPVAQPQVGAAAGPHAGDGEMSTSRLLRSSTFWILTACVGILVAGGISGLAHILAFATERGLSFKEAALLVSVLGGSSTLGAICAGFLCDRIGGLRTLMLSGAGFAIGWITLFLTTTTPPMLAAVMLVGLCSGGVYPSFSVLAGKLFGRAALPRVLGLYGFLALPMTILLPPLAGASRDATGNYQLMTLAFVLIGCTTAIVLLVMSRILIRSRDAGSMSPSAA